MTPGNGFQRNNVHGSKSGLEAFALIQIDRVVVYGGRGKELRNDQILNKKILESY